MNRLSATEKLIVDSQAFKMLNYLIDQKVEEVKYAVARIKNSSLEIESKNESHDYLTIGTRTSQESEKTFGDEVEFNLSCHNAQRISDAWTEIVQLRKDSSGCSCRRRVVVDVIFEESK